MAGLARKFFKIFGIDAPGRIGVFGSFAEGDPETSTDPEVIQSLDAWGGGWDEAIPIEEGAPALQDFNGFFYALAYQMAYVLERGIPDWNSLTTYNIGDIVKNSTGSIFKSLQDTNLNHAVTSTTWWYPAAGVGGLTPVAVTTSGTVVANTEENVVMGATVTRTMPSLPTAGQVPISVLILDADGQASSTKFITIAPATGEQLDGYAINDTLSIDYPGGWVALYAAAGATSWKLQTQANTMGPPPGLVPGYTGGQPIPTGYIGEKITWVTPPSTFPLTTTLTDWANAFLTLSPGVWQIYANISCAYNTGTASGNNGYAGVIITDAANVIVQEMDKMLYALTPAAAAVQVISSLPFSFVVSISVSTVYKIRAIKVDNSGVGSAQVQNQSAQRSQFFAVRIA